MNIIITCILGLGMASVTLTFMSEDMEKHLLEVATNDKLQLAVTEDALYGCEVLDFYSNKDKIDEIKLHNGLVRTAIQERSGMSDEKSRYEFERLVTGWAAGVLDINTADKDFAKILERAEQAKKPVETRIGKLLKAQHQQWKRDGGWANVMEVDVFRQKFTREPARNGRLNLFIQILLIFGFFNLEDPAYCAFLVGYIEKSDFFSKYIQQEHMILPPIDRVTTLMLHDPKFTAHRNDKWSTMENFKAANHMLSETDGLVIDFLKSGFQTNYHPSMLFRR